MISPRTAQSRALRYETRNARKIIAISLAMDFQEVRSSRRASHCIKTIWTEAATNITSVGATTAVETIIS